MQSGENRMHNLCLRKNEVEDVLRGHRMSFLVSIISLPPRQKNNIFITDQNLVASEWNAASGSIVTRSVITSRSSMAKFIAWGFRLLPCLCALVSTQQLSSLLFSSPH